MNKLQAIEYLNENSVYNDEWSGCGMWMAVIKVLESKEEKISKEFCDNLLKEAGLN